jgi:hypothetical protein
MSSPERRRYTVRDKQGAQWIGSLVSTLEPDWVITIHPPRRSPSQSDLFHSLVDQIAKALPEYKGHRMDRNAWKTLLIVSHSIATAGEDDGRPLQLVPDLEGQGLVQIRESSARMSKSRGSSLIEYTAKTAAELGVQLREMPPYEKVSIST